jgi:hypothetical protein
MEPLAIIAAIAIIIVAVARRQLSRDEITTPVAAPSSPPRRSAQCEAIRQKLRPALMYDEGKIDRLVAMERARTPGASDEALHAAAYERWVRDNR